MYKQRLKLWGLSKYKMRYQGDIQDVNAERHLTYRGKVIDTATRSQVLFASTKAVRTGALIQNSPGYRVTPLYIGIASPFTIEENTYHAMRDYYLETFRNIFVPKAHSLPTGIVAIENPLSEDLQDMYYRFRIGLKKITAQPADPAAQAEGLKILRVCFVRLPAVLRGKDPSLITVIIDLIRRVEESGNTILIDQVRGHICWLAKIPGQPNSVDLLARILQSGLPLNNYHRTLLNQIAVDTISKYAGPWHGQVLELASWVVVNRAMTVEEYGVLYEDLYKRFDEGVGSDVFDGRHLDLIQNMAQNKHQQKDSVGTMLVLNSVLQSPERLAALQQVPVMHFNYRALAGRTLDKGGRHIEAEVHLREAVRLVSLKVNNGDDDDADYIWGLTCLEENLRNQNRAADADGVLALRQKHIRDSLEKVGERESGT